jgi:ribonuclease BN (tRNA processing enzyme)
VTSHGTSLELFVAGAGPSYTDRPGALGASYVLRAGDARLLLDLGQGAFPNVAAEDPPERLLATLISHLHPDHFIDLVSFRHYLHWQLTPSGRARVIGPAGLGDRIDALHAEPGFSAAAFDMESLQPGQLTIGPFLVDVGKVRHTDDSYAFRVSAGGAGLVYSGDCGHAEDLEPLIRPMDVLLTEVSFGPGPVPPGAEHLDGPSVGALAKRSGVGGVLLTHLQMGFDPDETIASVQAVFDGPVTLVQPGERLALAWATWPATMWPRDSPA